MFIKMLNVVLINMDNTQIPYNYLRGLFQTWKDNDGTLERHVPILIGRQKLVKEFNADVKTVKANVCPYIKELGYAQSRSLILWAAEGLAGFAFDFPLVGTADLTLGALMDVCGFKKQGDQLIERGL